MSTTKTKLKTRALPVAQTRDEAEYAIARIGRAQREMKRIEADLGDRVAAAKAKAEASAEPLKAQIAADQAAVQGWCEANRADLTFGNKVKFAILNTGEVKWRLRPPRVSVRSADAVIAWLQERMQGRFLRTKVEVDKDALLADPAAAALIPGVTVGSEGEDFVIEPFDAELAMGAAA